MPQRDAAHASVVQALIRDGWVITHDPFIIEFEDERVFVDLGAERLLAAEQDGHKIAVEIKMFTGSSVIADVEQALGQYLLYRGWLSAIEPERQLYLAVSREVADSIFTRPAISFLVTLYQLQTISIDFQRAEVVEWRT